ncbi:S-adenosylmethionine:tRNA ribosyltransferase-isomerase [Niabella yanshanensis]|uniref:S-adenosylmethionine:tRNA ribosyltransferase-isomerase n=1 Tax=Niabella yanshanensis TaxID=577386 RepID=A0ABZ0WA72_9BACT|nr:S-adenosylmethionine:tRNA ribosyltransferase-isomerase [Niabella yanshanensis]WQD40177.1 S-adenosylmethionine:tRNA ribosyltransferase-isomerase [Niabella yanshanensis]
MHPKYLSIKDFTYNLPEEKIAFHPLDNRDDARLLVFKNEKIQANTYRNIAAHIPEETLMIFNNTKVVEARLLFKKDTGSVIEVFCLQPHEIYADITTAMNQTGSVQWLCLVGGASKWKKEQVLQLRFEADATAYTLEGALIEKRSDCFVVELSWNGNFSFAEVLHHAGHVPLPPYIKRQDETADKSRYQTVFARYDGSVAAPTAGLHFTENVLSSLRQKNINTAFVTLHVGAGTFRPVKADTMLEHDMHSEFIEVERALIEQLIEQGNKVLVAVGTTSLRTLESLYWLGARLITNPQAFENELPFLSQWEAYEHTDTPHKTDALKALQVYLSETGSSRLVAKTQIIIAPGYTFKMIDGLVTNFHQPSSTLLLLVAALIGDNWRKVYDYALQNDFRFLSYGDGSLLWK